MKDKELESALTEQIEKFGAAVEDIAEFSKEQLPEVVEQLLMWNFIASVFWGVVASVAFIIGIIYTRRLLKKVDLEAANFDWVFPTIICGFFFYLTVFCVSVNQLSEAAQILIAPKVWVLEYANDLRK